MFLTPPGKDVDATIVLGVNAATYDLLQHYPALAELAARLAEVLRGLAADLRGLWSRTHADRWLERARAVGAGG